MNGRLNGSSGHGMALPLAVRAAALEDDVVLIDARGNALPDRLDRPLERLVLERNRCAANAADEMVVMMVPIRQGRFEAGGLAAEVEALYEPQLLEHLQRAVDRRDSDLLLAPAQVVSDVLGRDDALLPPDRVEHRGARSARLEPVLAEPRFGDL